MLEMASGLVGADASESAGGGTDNDPSIITLRALEGYWQVYGSLLAHDIRSPDGEIISLSQAMSCADRRVATLALALSNLQTMVLRQLQPAFVRAVLASSQACQRGPASIAPVLLLAGGQSRKRTRSCSALSLGSSGWEESRRCSQSDGAAPVAGAGGEDADRRENFVVPSSSVAEADNNEEEEMMTMMGARVESTESSLCDSLSSLEGEEATVLDNGGSVIHGSRSPQDLQPRQSPRPSHKVEATTSEAGLSNDWVIVERMVESIGAKIAKAQWSKDLQEFSTEYSLPPPRFGSIRDSISGRCERYVRKGVRLLSASPRRPCWAISGHLAGEILGIQGHRLLGLADDLGPDGLAEEGVHIHTIYLVYDYDRELFSVKAICSHPILEYGDLDGA